MTPEQISENFKIPLVKVKRLAKAGLLKCEKEDPRIKPIKLALRNGRHMSALHCLALMHEPALLEKLGVYREAAERQLAALGDVVAGSFGPNVGALIYGAAIMDRDCIPALVALVREKTRPGLSYHALVCRMLWELSGPKLFQTANYCRKAVANLKNHPDLENWIDPKMIDL